MGNKENFVVFRWRYWIRGLQMIQLHVINSNWFNVHICIHIDAIHVMCLQEKFCWCVPCSYVTFKCYVGLLLIYVLRQGFMYVKMWYVKYTHVPKHLFTYMFNEKTMYIRILGASLQNTYTNRCWIYTCICCMCFVCCANVYIHVIRVNLICVYVIDTELFRFCGKKSIRFY